VEDEKKNEEWKRAAYRHVRYYLEDIKTQSLFIEEQYLSKREKLALKRLREDVDLLLEDIKRGYIKVE